MATMLVPSKVLRLTKAGKLPRQIKGGHPKCIRCRTVDKRVGTESPTYWENGMYSSCTICGQLTLHGAVYPPCEGFPEGIEVDTRGERKRYPMTIPLN